MHDKPSSSDFRLATHTEFPYSLLVTGRQFEWDDAKAQSNLAKHRLSFEYAARVFHDPDAIDYDASKPDDGETRRKVVGVIEGRLFTVVYTDRDGITRMISARRSNSRERQAYGPIHPRS